MSGFNSKVCVIGDFAVGKTSTVERFVNNQFSDKYLTTIGVKVDTKNVLVGDVDLKLIIWDIAGADRFGEIEFAYMRGASALIMVADGTRVNTVTSVQKIREQVLDRYGDLPHVLLINKADLKNSWEVSDGKIETLRETCDNVYLTSAKTGDHVEEALCRLAEQIVARDFA